MKLRDVRSGVGAVLTNALSGCGNQNTFATGDGFEFQVRFRVGGKTPEAVLSTYPGGAVLKRYAIKLQEIFE